MKSDILCSIALYFFENSVGYVEKYCKAGQGTDDNMAHAHFMLVIQGYKHALTKCNIYCFSTATVVARTHLNITLLRYMYIAYFVQYLAVSDSASHRGQFYRPDLQVLGLIPPLFISICFFFCVSFVVFKCCEHACSEQEDQEEF